MIAVPRVVIRVPAYEGVEHLPEALESLLSQRFADLAIVVTDDSVRDEPGHIVRRYAKRDPRIVYRRNERRLGMAANWRAAFLLASERSRGCRCSRGAATTMCGIRAGSPSS